MAVRHKPIDTNLGGVLNAVLAAAESGPHQRVQT
jgi:hypothetical protein